MSDFKFELNDNGMFDRFNAQREQLDEELERIGKLTASRSFIASRLSHRSWMDGSETR